MHPMQPPPPFRRHQPKTPCRVHARTGIPFPDGTTRKCTQSERDADEDGTERGAVYQFLAGVETDSECEEDEGEACHRFEDDGFGR